MMCRVARQTVAVCRRSGHLFVSTLGHVMMLKRHLATVLSVTMVMMVGAGRGVIITALRVLLALKCLLRIRFQAGDLFRSQFAK